MSKIKNLNPAIVASFALCTVLLIRNWFDLLTFCAVLASAVTIVYSLVTGGGDRE